MYTCGWFKVMYGRNQGNYKAIILQLNFSFKIKGKQPMQSTEYINCSGHLLLCYKPPQTYWL